MAVSHSKVRQKKRARGTPGVQQRAVRVRRLSPSASRPRGLEARVQEQAEKVQELSFRLSSGTPSKRQRQQLERRLEEAESKLGQLSMLNMRLMGNELTLQDKVEWMEQKAAEQAKEADRQAEEAERRLAHAAAQKERNDREMEALAFRAQAQQREMSKRMAQVMDEAQQHATLGQRAVVDARARAASAERRAAQGAREAERAAQARAASLERRAEARGRHDAEQQLQTLRQRMAEREAGMFQQAVQWEEAMRREAAARVASAERRGQETAAKAARKQRIEAAMRSAVSKAKKASRSKAVVASVVARAKAATNHAQAMQLAADERRQKMEQLASRAHEHANDLARRVADAELHVQRVEQAHLGEKHEQLAFQRAQMAAALEQQAREHAQQLKAAVAAATKQPPPGPAAAATATATAKKAPPPPPPPPARPPAPPKPPPLPSRPGLLTSKVPSPAKIKGPIWTLTADGLLSNRRLPHPPAALKPKPRVRLPEGQAEQEQDKEKNACVAAMKAVLQDSAQLQLLQVYVQGLLRKLSQHFQVAPTTVQAASRLLQVQEPAAGPACRELAEVWQHVQGIQLKGAVAKEVPHRELSCRKLAFSLGMAALVLHAADKTNQLDLDRLINADIVSLDNVPGLPVPHRPLSVLNPWHQKGKDKDNGALWRQDLLLPYDVKWKRVIGDGKEVEVHIEYIQVGTDGSMERRIRTRLLPSKWELPVLPDGRPAVPWLSQLFEAVSSKLEVDGQDGALSVKVQARSPGVQARVAVDSQEDRVRLNLRPRSPGARVHMRTAQVLTLGQQLIRDLFVPDNQWEKVEKLMDNLQESRVAIDAAVATAGQMRCRLSKPGSGSMHEHMVAALNRAGCMKHVEDMLAALYSRSQR